MNKAEYQRINLKVMVLRRLTRFLRLRYFKNISNSSNRVDHFLREIFVDFVSEPADQHVDDIRLRVEIIVPDVFQNHSLGNHSSGVAQQILKQCEFARLKIYL